MIEAARTPAQRKQDTLRRLEQEVDAWVATAADGAPYMIPLSYLWQGETILIATPAASITGRNLQATGTVRLGIGATRDVILIEGSVEALALSDLPAADADAFAAKAEFDPRRSTAPYLYFRIRPRLLQAWREENELAGRTLLRDGQWLVP